MTDMTHANILLPTGQRIVLRCESPAPHSGGGFRWSVDRWATGRGWQGYMPISERVALGLLVRRVQEY